MRHRETRFPAKRVHDQDADFAAVLSPFLGFRFRGGYSFRDHRCAKTPDRLQRFDKP